MLIRFSSHAWLRNVALTAVLIGMTIAPYWAFAQTDGAQRDAQNILNEAAGSQGARFNVGAGSTSLSNVLAAVLNGLFALLGVVFLAYMVWAGWMWLTAGGNEEQVSRAKRMIQQAIIGVIVVVAAYALTYFVLSALVGPGSGGGQVPPANGTTGTTEG